MSDSIHSGRVNTKMKRQGAKSAKKLLRVFASDVPGVFAANYALISSQNFFRSILPPETMQTIGPSPAWPVSAAATEQRARAFGNDARLLRHQPHGRARLDRG